MLKHEKNGIHIVIVYIEKNELVIWLKIHGIKIKLGVKNISDLTINEIKGIFNSRIPKK